LAKAGDCDDFALEKRAQLSEAGVPFTAMRLALCEVETGEPHAVLVVKDEEGNDWILDNRQPLPYTLDEFRGLGYRGISLQVILWRRACSCDGGTLPLGTSCRGEEAQRRTYTTPKTISSSGAGITGTRNERRYPTRLDGFHCRCLSCSPP
jgi:hypothetical protein